MVNGRRGSREARVDLQQRRDARGLNQAALAELVGVAERTVRAWEAGDNWPHTGHYRRLLVALDIDLAELLRLLDTPRRAVEGCEPKTRAGAAVGGRSPVGIVSGLVLALSRRAAGLAQERLAEHLGVDVGVVQEWESGRRSLAALGAGELLGLGTRLARAGAPGSIRRYLTDAVEADLVLTTGLASGAGWVDPVRHPLAASVHRRDVTNLITWPLTGHLPPQLGGLASAVPSQDRVVPQPLLHADERALFFDHLLFTAQRATYAGEPLLRRQAVYLLGFDRRQSVIDWLHGEWRRVGRQAIPDGDVTGLLEARSASVALASAGDSEHIHDFVDRATSTRAEIANLNYWAYWIGEIGDVRIDDSFMRDEDTRSWHGARLLAHLAGRLDPTAPHLPLNLNTLHTLVATRPALLDAGPSLRTALATSLDRLASGVTLTRSGRDQVSGLHYALRISGR